MKEYNIKKLTEYLHRVNNRLEKYVTAIRADVENNVVLWDDCKLIGEADDLANWIGHQVDQLASVVKEQRFGFCDLYRCKKVDPLGLFKEGKLYRLRKWNGTYIACGEGFAINDQSLNVYFERATETEDGPTT